jgi:pyridoxal phosphate enzyme (YggS family)
MKAHMNSIPLYDAPDIAGNLEKVRAEIRAAEAAAGRNAGAVNLVAVSKIFPAAAVSAALAAGQRLFGENRVQEAAAKWPRLKADFADVRLHLIGPLQRNKVKEALRLFDVIETVDRPKLARALAEGMEKTGARPDCFIQVNTGEEEQKAGVAPEQAETFVKTCREEFQLPVKGLMCIPPQAEEAALHFALLAEIAERCGLQDLSMGMSADYQKAIALGATFVRLGTAVFGPRPQLKGHLT